MKFRFKPILTFDEYKEAACKFWYKNTWLAKVLKERFLEKYGEQYIVDYSFADSNGYWGQRKQMDFKAESKNSHSDVEKYFHEIMKEQKINDYRIHSISVA